MMLYIQVAEMGFFRRVAVVFLRDTITSSAICEELRVKLLLHCIERSQLRWFGRLLWMPPGPGTSGCPGAEPGPGGETVSVHWPGNALETSSQSWLMWPGKAKSGAPCWNCYLCDLMSDTLLKMDGRMYEHPVRDLFCYQTMNRNIQFGWHRHIICHKNKRLLLLLFGGPRCISSELFTTVLVPFAVLCSGFLKVLDKKSNFSVKWQTQKSCFFCFAWTFSVKITITQTQHTGNTGSSTHTYAQMTAKWTDH